ncbi:hypothetical protein E4T38_04037 [Aureobasidium subglaciale]|nr:hypothetical protein E4T38_04037 [Aureobasidium subglaciale]KAI5224772.1 hypothetical protein E4T40_03812 [Aureobasidium subglaciale]KAI5227954.1 hypothetical protein E4T41_04032 [Aureobasidium subglaciale]KAI5263474.1 hypothetical protein E4T46_03653 [Aureobasidium subglaciale]
MEPKYCWGWIDFLSRQDTYPQLSMRSATPTDIRDPKRNFDNPYDARFGVQVSITGGDKPKKSTLAERAARFGRHAFGSRSASAGSNFESQRPSLPGHYTAMKNASGLSREGSRLSASASTSSLVSQRSKTRSMRDSVASSIYDEPETTDPAPPLKIAKKAIVPQLPPICSESDLSSLHTATGRHSTDSNDSTRTVTQPRLEPSRSHFSWTTYAETERSISPTSSYIGDTSIAQEPDSRFSWTTTSTDTNYQQDTPPLSPTPTPPGSIMSRRRPVPGRETGLPPKRHDSMGDVQDLHETRYDKVLPQPPKTRQERDHVDELMSRLESLELQKQNMQKLFKDLEKIESASPIEVSERMRRENRRKMGEVQTRQDEVQRELFEVGRLLSRARAKAEEANGSTGLWLRRVTD